jgi:prepilin-type N-terminal cleavage/methylation domain-containing protein
MKRASDKDRGFTLLELLISISLLTIILAAVYSTFSMSHKALDGTDASLLKLQEGRMTLDMLCREMESLLYSPSNRFSVLKVEDRDIYDRQASRLAFTTFSPLKPGLSLVSYYVEEKDGKLTLLKKIRSAFAPDNPEERGVELIEDLQSFTVEAMLKGKWVKTWNSSDTTSVPDELRVTITFMINNRPFTLYETVNPKIGKAL